MPAPEIERWCEIVAAMKVRTTNRKGRHLSTVRTLQLLVEHGVDTPDGFRKLDPGTLTASTLNRHLRRLGYDHERMIRQPPAVRFQAERSNALWHFDMSPSDLKQLKAPPWIDADRQGAPTLMLFSIVDDRSGVATRSTAASTAKMPRRRCAFCSMPWRPRRPLSRARTRTLHSRASRNDLPGQRTGREVGGVQARDGEPRR